jgi:LemA protein
MRVRLAMLALTAVLTLSGCGYNTLQSTDEQINAAWAEVLNQYKRRADLIPNLVNTVKAYAAHEQQVLLGVTNARAKVGSIQATPELVNNPEAFQKFLQAQGEMSSALARLLVVAENYPQLKADQNFRDLQAQLEGTENRVTVARQRYIKAVQEYNVTVRSFPSNLTAMVFGFKTKPSLPSKMKRLPSRLRSISVGRATTAPASTIPPSPPSEYSTEEEPQIEAGVRLRRYGSTLSFLPRVPLPKRGSGTWRSRVQDFISFPRRSNASPNPIARRIVPHCLAPLIFAAFAQPMSQSRSSKPASPI